MVLGSLLKRDIELFWYSPRQVKQALTGNGNASKSQMGKMIGILLNMRDQDIGNDENDALAVAYCHLMSNKVAHHDFYNKG